MRFDALWGFDDDDQAVGQTGDLPLAPDGRHTGEILKATFQDLKFKRCDENKQGTSLVVVIDIPKAQTVEAIIPCHYRGMFERVCAAASVPPPKRDTDWQPDQLVGRTVTVETVHVIAASGTEYVRVAKWFPGPPALPEAIKQRATPARTQAQKAAKELADDDIPF